MLNNKNNPIPNCLHNGKLRRFLFTFVVFIGSVQLGNAQDVALKTNLLSDAFTNLNLGVEVGLAPKWTLDIPIQYNPFSFRNGAMMWKHLTVQPEARYWFCDRFSGHFVGIHAHGGIYNVGGIKNNMKYLGYDLSRLTNERFQGWFIGAGVAYGYAFILGRHWNLELEVGVGYAYTRQDAFKCTGCGKKTEENVPRHYVGPTKGAINLVYVF
ncbi:MAG: DUF3575 domain-containing protein [Bacteroidales bacterium]|nr:DUF3575 domain-containing protein [Bacteroidales bacterium]